MTLKEYCLEIEKFLKEYLDKSHCKAYILGLSGGVDSSLVAAIARKAVGKDKLFCYALPIYSNPKDVEDAKKVDAAVFYCRVSIPNAGCHNEEFPELYMVCLHGNKNEMRRDYISFIMNREEKYKQAMLNHRNDPRNQKHTDWKANVQVCRMSKE
jgi:hypothetical protein